MTISKKLFEPEGLQIGRLPGFGNALIGSVFIGIISNSRLLFIISRHLHFDASVNLIPGITYETNRNKRI